MELVALRAFELVENHAARSFVREKIDVGPHVQTDVDVHAAGRSVTPRERRQASQRRHRLGASALDVSVAERKRVSVIMSSSTGSFDLERKLEGRFSARLRRRFLAGDRFAARFMERHSVTVLRVALAVVFIWFGALKVLDRSPVEDIVKATVFFLPGDAFFFALGLVEIAIGIGLLIPIALRVTLVLLWLQLGGTFLTLAVLPELAFQGGNPLLLSVLGEFVVKNVVLIAAGLVIGTSIRRPRHLAPPHLPRWAHEHQAPALVEHVPAHAECVCTPDYVVSSSVRARRASALIEHIPASTGAVSGRHTQRP